MRRLRGYPRRRRARSNCDAAEYALVRAARSSRFASPLRRGMDASNQSVLVRARDNLASDGANPPGPLIRSAGGAAAPPRPWHPGTSPVQPGSRRRPRGPSVPSRVSSRCASKTIRVLGYAPRIPVAGYSTCPRLHRVRDREAGPLVCCTAARSTPVLRAQRRVRCRRFRLIARTSGPWAAADRRDRSLYSFSAMRALIGGGGGAVARPRIARAGRARLTIRPPRSFAVDPTRCLTSTPPEPA